MMKRYAVAVVLLGLGGLLTGQDGRASRYTPVAPGSAHLRAMRLSLEAVEDWVKERDFKSAAETCEEVVVLAQLARQLEGPAAWSAQVGQLEQLVRSLQAAARGKNREECLQLVEKGMTQLETMAGAAPGVAPGAGKSFRPTGSVKTWMVLVDAAYSEARTARSAQDMELLALALAEEANALAYLRSDGRWHATSHQLRDVALEAGRKARAEGLEAGKAHLKKAYARCEACHEGFRR